MVGRGGERGRAVLFLCHFLLLFRRVRFLCLVLRKFVFIPFFFCYILKLVIKEKREIFYLLILLILFTDFISCHSYYHFVQIENNINIREMKELRGFFMKILQVQNFSFSFSFFLFFHFLTFFPLPLFLFLLSSPLLFSPLSLSSLSQFLLGINKRKNHTRDNETSFNVYKYSRCGKCTRYFEIIIELFS